MKYRTNELYQELELFDDNDVKIGEAEVDVNGKMLSRLTIYQPYQNKGYGTEIVKKLIKDYNIDCLWVNADNTRAIHVYEKCGFTKINPTMWLMKREVGDSKTNNGDDDLISRRAAIDAVSRGCQEFRGIFERCEKNLNELPSAQPERLTDDDFETIRLHLNAYKERLYNQGRWKEAEDYQRIIARFMAFVSAQPAQPESENITFWEKRAREYEEMVLKLTDEMARGIKIDSVLITEEGIVFKKEKPEQQWIPWGSGKFPEESGTYTVTAYDGATKRVTYAKYQKRLKRWELTGARAYWRVLAWMPLPKPYREDVETK